MKKIRSYSSFLNEKVEEYDFGFTTIIEGNSVSYYGEDAVVDKSKDQYIGYIKGKYGNYTIVWEMDFDNRTPGINSMSPIIHSVSGVYSLLTPKEEYPDLEEEIKFEVKNEDKEWEIKADLVSDFSFGYGFHPNDIEIDFKSKKITINF